MGGEGGRGVGWWEGETGRCAVLTAGTVVPVCLPPASNPHTAHLDYNPPDNGIPGARDGTAS